MAISPAARGNTFLCKGKGLFSESAPIPLHPVTLKTPHTPLPPYSLRGFSFGHCEHTHSVIADAVDGQPRRA